MLNGLVYLIYSIASRHLARDLAPTAPTGERSAASIVDHCASGIRSGEAAKRYNVLQKLAYLSVIFVLLPLVILMGLGDVAAGWMRCFPAGSTCSADGQSARTIHFIAAWLLVAFVAGSRVRGDRLRLLEPPALDDHRALSRRRRRLRMDRVNRARRRFFARALAGGGALALAGCERLSQSEWFPRMLGAGEKASSARVASRCRPQGDGAGVHARPTCRRSFRSNGTAEPDSRRVSRTDGGRFRGLSPRGRRPGRSARCLLARRAEGVAEPHADHAPRLRRGLERDREMAGRASSMRVLDAARPEAEARYVVFHCADPMDADGTDFYYESIDLDDAYHPQTILAYEMNDAPLPIKNGAPLRLRVERQLGYKHAKYVMRIELVQSFAHIAGGNGGYWEDQGYEWYAGI